MANTVRIKPVATKKATIIIESTSSMVQHNWDEKAKRQMREKKAGKKTKDREPCDPVAEFKAATYFTADGEYGIPSKGLKACLISAAHKDLGIEKTLVRKSLFIPCDDANLCLPIVCADPKMREDGVNVSGRADLRYRPEFTSWECAVPIEYDSGNLTIDDIVNLINRAGFGVGIGEHRPEKGGDWGRFQVKATE